MTESRAFHPVNHALHLVALRGAGSFPQAPQLEPYATVSIPI